MEEDQLISILDLWDSFRKRFRAIIMIMALSILIAVAATYLPSPKYEATVKLLFPQGGVGGVAAVVASLGVSIGPQNPIETYQEILDSRPLIEKVASRTNLPFQKAQKAVKIGRNNSAGIIEINARGNTAAQAAWIANSYRWALEEMDRKLKLSTVTPEVSFAQEQLQKAKVDLDKATKALREFQEKHNIFTSTGSAGGLSIAAAMAGLSGSSTLSSLTGTPGVTLPSVSGNIFAFGDQLRATEIQLRDVETRLQEFKSRQKQILQSAMDLPATAPLAQKWREQLLQKEYELAVTRHQYGDSHPRVVFLQQDLEEVKKQVRDEIGRSEQAVEQGIVPDLINLEVEKIATQARRDALADLVAKGPQLGEEFNRLQQEVQFQSSLYATLRAQYTQYEMDRQKSPNRWEVLEDAVPPDEPSNRRIIRNLALAIVGGSLLSLLTILTAGSRQSVRGREVLDPSDQPRLPV